jgi:hypothetical protein
MTNNKHITMEMKPFIVIVSLFISTSLPNAQDKSFLRHEFQFTLGANSHQAMEIEPNYSFMFNKFIGFTTGINFMAQMFDNTHYYSEDAKQWAVADGLRKASTFLFRPALRLRFPLFKEDGENIIYFNMEPGAFINLIPNSTLRFDLIEIHNPVSKDLPSASKRITNEGGQVFFYHVKGYFSADFDGWIASAGFAYSDFDIYSGWRNLKIEGISVNEMIWSKRTTRTLFVSLSYCF